MQRVTPVPAQVGLLGAGQDKCEKPADVKEGAHRVHPWATIAAHRGQEGQAHAELIKQRTPGSRKVRPLLLELVPGHHGPPVCPGAKFGST
jgi:hypothetical protein